MNTQKNLIIKKQNYSKDIWDETEPVKIECYKWLDNNYKPDVYIRLFYDENSIYVKFSSYEKEISVRHFLPNEDVCEDSCVEFFFGPYNNSEYINLEINALGIYLAGIGKDRYSRKKIDINSNDLCISSSVTDADAYRGDCWNIEFRIPFGFIRNHFKDFDISDGLAANFYKCGDKTKYAHYGMWSEVLTDSPDFHQRKFFGKIIFE